MQDKSFLLAIQDLQDRISNNYEESLYHMLLHQTTVTGATIDIKDEKMRTVVTNTLMTDQIISLLTILKDLQMLSEAQHKEFTAYLLHTLTSRHEEIITGTDSK